MTDIVTRQTRSRMMAAIKSKNTRPEIALRRQLFALGFRYRLHPKNLPGRPDLVLPRYRAAIFVHGCFWHAHDCRDFRWPKSNRAFWERKLRRNVALDEATSRRLKEQGWRVLIVWECAIRHAKPGDLERLGSEVAAWLRSNRSSAQFNSESHRVDELTVDHQQPGRAAHSATCEPSRPESQLGTAADRD